MKCEKCNQELKCEVSHDIPKYLGGFDCDGRHWLCMTCHDKYERTILSRCWIKFFNELLPFTTREGYSKYMRILLNSPYARQSYFIAWEVKKEWWGPEDDGISKI